MTASLLPILAPDQNTDWFLASVPETRNRGSFFQPVPCIRQTALPTASRSGQNLHGLQDNPIGISKIERPADAEALI